MKVGITLGFSRRLHKDFYLVIIGCKGDPYLIWQFFGAKFLARVTKLRVNNPTQKYSLERTALTIILT